MLCCCGRARGPEQNRVSPQSSQPSKMTSHVCLHKSHDILIPPPQSLPVCLQDALYAFNLRAARHPIQREAVIGGARGRQRRSKPKGRELLVGVIPLQHRSHGSYGLCSR